MYVWRSDDVAQKFSATSALCLGTYILYCSMCIYIYHIVVCIYICSVGVLVVYICIWCIERIVVHDTFVWMYKYTSIHL